MKDRMRKAPFTNKFKQKNSFDHSKILLETLEGANTKKSFYTYDLRGQYMSETINNVKRSRSNGEDKKFFPFVNAKRSKAKPYNLHPFFIESKKRIGILKNLSFEKIKELKLETINMEAKKNTHSSSKEKILFDSSFQQYVKELNRNRISKRRKRSMKENIHIYHGIKNDNEIKPWETIYEDTTEL